MPRPQRHDDTKKPTPISDQVPIARAAGVASTPRRGYWFGASCGVIVGGSGSGGEAGVALPAAFAPSVASSSSSSSSSSACWARALAANSSRQRPTRSNPGCHGEREQPRKAYPEANACRSSVHRLALAVGVPNHVQNPRDEECCDEPIQEGGDGRPRAPHDLLRCRPSRRALRREQRAPRPAGQTRQRQQQHTREAQPRHHIAPSRGYLLLLDADADLERPGIDEHAREFLPSGEAVYRAHVADRQAEVADAGDIDLDARVDAELPERRRDRSDRTARGACSRRP